MFRYELHSAAAAEYRRALFALEADSTTLTDTLWLKLGLSLGASRGAAAAADALRRATERNPRLGFDAQMALAGLYAREGRTQQARLELSDLLIFARDSARSSQLRGLLAFLALQDGDLAQAGDEFRAAGRNDLADAAVRSGARGRRNATVATILSFVLPGSGEAYAGRPALGLLSLGVTGGAAVGTYFAARSGDWVTATVLFTTLFLRFYNGSHTNAADLVTTGNESRARNRARDLAVQHGLAPDWFAGVRWFTGPGYPPALERESLPAR
jgi:tetratricopeptide (TPR) repeat protein